MDVEYNLTGRGANLKGNQGFEIIGRAVYPEEPLPGMPIPAAAFIYVPQASAFFCVISETTTRVMKLRGMEIRPGLLNGISAVSGSSP